MFKIIAGKENMIRDGVILDHAGFRDWYDENVLPQMSDEYPYSLRWLHTIQEADVKYVCFNILYNITHIHILYNIIRQCQFNVAIESIY